MAAGRRHVWNLMRCIVLAGLGLLWAGAGVHAAHPQVLVTPADRAEMQSKVTSVPWARTSYAALKERVDGYVAASGTNAQWLSSRLFLHWTNHYTTAVVEQSRWVRGEGRAPVPTPRFAGARDWAAPYSMPGDIAKWPPFNEDAEGRVWVINSATGKGEWTDAGMTGMLIEGVNSRIMQAAADAAFVYWITGDEAYARMASDVLCTYVEGFAHVTPPRVADHHPGTERIIGSTSFEVIHEAILPPLGLAYDFLHDYLVKQGRDVKLIQAQLKRMADRVIAGGDSRGNWNLNQAYVMTYAVLALEDDASYADGRGRQHYVDVLLNADLPRQRGLMRVIAEDYDPDTALWPEATGYAFGTTAQIIQIASLLGNDPRGEAVLTHSILPRAILAQLQLLHPNGWSTAMGDTGQVRVNAQALELMIAFARKRGNTALEDTLTAALLREVADGTYRREKQTGLLALTRYVPELKKVPAGTAERKRTYFGKPLNMVFQRNDAPDPGHALSAAMYGTGGAHAHAHGLAVELYGAGAILGADPGRGSSYWQKDHHEYYSQSPAHNTVIVNGASSYPAHGARAIAMRVDAVEPAFGAEGVSPNLSFVQASFDYANPGASQQRTLALIRTGDTGGFYFDVFRSRAQDKAGSFHDYLYHNVGQSLALRDAGGAPLAAKDSHDLAAEGLLPGYRYFDHERSAAWTNDVHGVFTATFPGGATREMHVWMPGAPDRTLYSLAAPPSHAGRASLPAELNRLPMPTLLVRQQGDAWTRPFVAVFEPTGPRTPGGITQVRTATTTSNATGLASAVVEGDGFQVCLMQDDTASARHAVEGNEFHGTFGAVVRRAGSVSELYLGSGRHLGSGPLSVTSNSGQKVAAGMRSAPSGWMCTASAPVSVSVTFPTPPDFTPARGGTIMRTADDSSVEASGATWRMEPSVTGEPIIVATCPLPAGSNQRIWFRSNR